MVCWVRPLPVRPGIIQTCNKFVNGETEHTGKNEFVSGENETVNGENDFVTVEN
jgi:hypothetical protein